MPFSWSTLKLSVTTRWPLMNTPNVPESICNGPAGFDLSFLSLALTSPAHNRVVPTRIATVNHRIRAIKVTAYLLASCGIHPCRAPEPTQPQSLQPSCRWSPAGTTPSGSAIAGPRRACENYPYCPVRDAQFLVLAPRPVPGNAATTPSHPHPERPWEGRCPRSSWHWPSAQRHRHREQRLSPLPTATRASIPVRLHAPPFEIRILQNHERCPPPSVARAVQSDHRDLRTSSPEVRRAPGPQCFCQRP